MIFELVCKIGFNIFVVKNAKNSDQQERVAKAPEHAPKAEQPIAQFPQNNYHQGSLFRLIAQQRLLRSVNGCRNRELTTNCKSFLFSR